MAAADQALAEEFGVNVALIIARRNQDCSEPEHFTREEVSGRITYTKEGRALMLAAFCATAPEKKEGGPESVVAVGDGGGPQTEPASTIAPDTAPEKKEGAGVSGAVVVAHVVRIERNPIWIMIQPPEGPAVQLRVRANTHIQVRQKLRVRQRPDGTWECLQSGIMPRR